MEEISLKDKNGKVMASSLEVAEKFGKRHDSVLRDIDKIIKSNNKLKTDFILSNYTNSRGKNYRCYLLTNKAIEILETKYIYSAMNPRFELKFENLLRSLFPSIVILSQYPILNYRIDFFMPDLCIIVEYDEEQHHYTQKADTKRIDDIKNELNRMLLAGESFYDDNKKTSKLLKDISSFSVIRVKKGHEIDGLRNICIEITSKTAHSCSDFMKINVAA